MGMGEQRTYTVTLERVMGDATGFAPYLVTLGIEAESADSIAGSLPHSWSGLCDDDSRLVEIALQAWGGVVSNTLDAEPCARRHAHELFPNLVAPAATTPAVTLSPMPAISTSFVTFKDEDTIDMAVGHIQEQPADSPSVAIAPAPLGGTYRWMSTVAVAAFAYAAVAVYGCAATWNAEHEFTDGSSTFGASIRAEQKRTGHVDRDDVIAIVNDLAAAAGVDAKADEIVIFAHFLDVERRLMGSQFNCIASRFPPEHSYLSVSDRMQLTEQVGHCEDAWIIGFRVPVEAKRLLKTHRFEGAESDEATEEPESAEESESAD
jgi:hypothetical protein